MKRRSFIKNTTLASATYVLPWQLSGHSSVKKEKLKFGLIADVHQDIMHDGVERLQAFIDESTSRKMEFIMQLGDFCRPYDYNQPFLDVWEQFKGSKYHLLGNHDTDGGFTRQQAMDFWGMKSRYYSFDKSGYHFVVLDGNDPNPKPWSGYNRYIDKEQQEWLKNDLKNTSLTTFVFSHQTLENEDGGVDNQKEIRKILEDANKDAGFNKIVASICGHHHTDYMTQIHDIYYVQINSASYRWVGGDYQHIRYSKEIDEKYPWIKYTIPYKDPLFTFVEINPKGYLTIEGSKTEFVGMGPKEMNGPVTAANDPIVPKISDFKMRF
ncbi:metallophosphoesterase [Reichenbachiella sp. MALMAid0571]|uniref:metallophosphoesterase family protein n=1 Tax=Reichenbachiella sp. MALMAid0571 TaxID=3143939 RepID=UPI0032E03932